MLGIGVGLLAIVGLVYLQNQPTVEPAASDRPDAPVAVSEPPPAPASVQSQPASVQGQVTSAGPIVNASAPSAAASDLLAAIEKQAPSVVQPQGIQRDASVAAARQIWMEMDKVSRSWPRYVDAREELRKELAASMDLEGVATDDLRSEAARLQAAFWQQEGYLSAQGYREAYKARLLLEIAHEREPGNLAITDELVEVIQTACPLRQYDPENKRMQSNEEMIEGLYALRAQSYEQTRKEVEQGRTFTWADFARTADYVYLCSGREPQKATEAFQWALSYTKGSEHLDFQARLLDGLARGMETRFSIYYKARAKYPQEYVYLRRLPSYRGPDPQARRLTAIWAIGDSRSTGR